ncbi:MAG: aspartate aminotransferase family protein [candidate division NC10 bacterium]|nr:aspartate aminotransferase family protein [candidate division NC10 bacterium]
MTNQEIIALTGKYVATTYARFPIALVRGEGCRVWDADGKAYLDFVAGIAVCALGHSHPRLVQAITAQARRLLHVSNLYHIEPQARLAELLCRHSFADRAFFCNSGAEANEAALKLARKYAKERFSSDRTEIITMRGSFHGRTLATVTATAQEKYQKGFEPLVPGFKYVPFNDLRAVELAVDARTAALLVEPIQGEGGVQVAADGYLAGLRKLCDERGPLLIFDEVQTGLGRTGTLFAYQQAGVAPDILTLAKALAGGIPMGTMLAREEVMAAFTPGTHAATFGGNPFASTVALETITTILEEDLPGRAARVGARILDRLRTLQARLPSIRALRGRGLLIGIEVTADAKAIVAKCMERGLLILTAGDTVLRLVPPLILSEAEADEGLGILEGVLGEAA